MDKVGFSDFLLCWRPVSADRETERAPVALRVPFARPPELETVMSLAKETLKRFPGSLEALEVLELLTPPSQRHTLRARYEAFLFAAPFHQESRRIREDLIDLLLEQRLYNAAAPHIAAITRRRVRPARVEEESDRPCATQSRQAWLDPTDDYEELDELDLEPCEDWEWRTFPRFKAGE